MATMSDEFDLFFGASFDGVRCCHATAGSRMPCMSADLLYLPFSHPSASACRMVASGEAAQSSPDAFMSTLWCGQLRLYRPKGLPDACRAADGRQGSRRGAALLAVRGAHEALRCMGPRANRISADCTTVL